MISMSMARIIAKISGDGNLSKSQIMYFNTCPTLIKEFKDDIKNEFGTVKMSEGIMSSKTPYVAVFGKKIVNILTEYLSSYNSSKIMIPEEVICSKEEIVKEYVRVFYDDEGCACLRLNKKTEEWKRNITLASNSHKILEQIKEILTKFGINSNRIMENNGNSTYDNSFVLSITGKDNFLKFQQNIGFKHPRKIEMLKLIVKSYDATSKNKKEFLKLNKKLSGLKKRWTAYHVSRVMQYTMIRKRS
jgi:intein/homing endonuclease